MSKRRGSGRGSNQRKFTPPSQRAAAVAQREQWADANPVKPASDKPRQVQGARRGVSQASHAKPPRYSDADLHAPHPSPLLDTRAMKPAAAAHGNLLWRHKGKFALGGAAATGGTAYLFHQRQSPKKELEVAKYYDPYTGDVVEFEKRERDTGRGAATGAKIGLGTAVGLSAASAGFASGANRKLKKNPKMAAHFKNVSGLSKIPHMTAAEHLRGAGRLGAAGLVTGALIGRKRTVAKTDILPVNTRSVTALLPTGGHVSHANDLQVFRPKGGRRMPRNSSPLQRYSR